MKRLINTRRRKAVASALVTMLVMACVAAAYFLATVTFSGENTGTTAKGEATNINETLTVTVPAVNITTTGNTPFAVSTISVPQARVLEAGAKLTAVFSTVPSTCKAEWFALEWTGTTLAQKLMEGGKSKEAITFPANTATPITGLSIRFTEPAGENQSPCSEAKLTAKVTLAGTGH
jgi:hypothetical protein